MFRFMLAKLKHKKWMLLCLLIGNILLVAVSSGYLVYQSASFERMFVKEFDRKWEKTGKWPFMLRTSAWTVTPEATENLYLQTEKMIMELDLPVKESHINRSIRSDVAKPVMARKGADQMRLSVGYMTGLEDHITIIEGRMYEETEYENYIEVIVNQETLNQTGVLLDEELVFEQMVNDHKDPLYIKVVGIFIPNDEKDFYWTDYQSAYAGECFMMAELFDETFAGREHEGYEIKYDTLLDYRLMDSGQADKITAVTNTWLEKRIEGVKIHEPAYLEVLNSYTVKVERISSTLFILSIPCMVLLCAFLFMISEQMLRMEQNEISMLKSRGARRHQILRLYFMQSVLVSLIGLVIGIPFGMFLCSLLGSAGAFLQFDFQNLLQASLTKDALIAAFVAMGVSIMMTVFPVIKYSTVTIVNLKQKSQRAKKPFWQKAYLDIILLVGAGYAYYSFSRSQETIREQILLGQTLDPFLYFGATFFILGCGLLFLRLHPVFIHLIYQMRKKWLSSASYMSFLGTIRSASKQQFIMLFMILTVSFGIFYATIARTILENADHNISYLNAVDMQVQEKWSDNAGAAMPGDSLKVEYYEPEFDRYEFIEGGNAVTKVLQDKVKVVGGRRPVKEECAIMGIQTKEFGEMVSMPENLLPLDFYDYLNALANTSNGVLLSENMRTEYGYAIGDTLIVDLKNRTFSLKVIGFFNYWPTYKPKEYSVGENGELLVKNKYMMVTNLSYVQWKADVTPYYVWMNFDESTDGFYDFVEENNIKVKAYTDMVVAKDDLRKDALFQGTNGVLSLSFIVILLLCGVGYLIYWILSIRSRELLFGVLRAMGMSKREVFHILFNEQIFCGVLSILVGIAIGAAAAGLYVPIIQNAYAATDQILPLKLVCRKEDLIKLFGTIIAVLITCIMVLLRIVSKSNITGALKLGED